MGLLRLPKKKQKTLLIDDLENINIAAFDPLYQPFVYFPSIIKHILSLMEA